jgi:hypothetical protein
LSDFDVDREGPELEYTDEVILSVQSTIVAFRKLGSHTSAPIAYH